MTLVFFTGGVLVAFAVVLWALMKAAGDADRRLAERETYRLAEVEHLSAARARRDTRNGLGRVGRPV